MKSLTDDLNHTDVGKDSAPNESYETDHHHLMLRKDLLFSLLAFYISSLFAIQIANGEQNSPIGFFLLGVGAFAFMTLSILALIFIKE